MQLQLLGGSLGNASEVSPVPLRQGSSGHEVESHELLQEAGEGGPATLQSCSVAVLPAALDTWKFSSQPPRPEPPSSCHLAAAGVLQNADHLLDFVNDHCIGL